MHRSRLYCRLPHLPWSKNTPGHAAGGEDQTKGNDQATRKNLMRNSALITYVSTETSLALPVKTFSTV